MKWALGAVALIAVIAVAVAVTLAFSRGGSHEGGTHGGGGKGSDTASGIASADDTGPVAVITDEPTCAKFEPINDGLADQQHNGWDQRDPAVPAADWTPEQRTQYEAVGTAMRNAADQYVSLAKKTPHRVVRELYEQFIAYARAYVIAIPNYTSRDNELVRTAASASSALYYACKALSLGSATTWGPSVPVASAPSVPVVLGDPEHPEKVMSSRDSICGDLVRITDQYVSDSSAWDNSDMTVPATQWLPEQSAIFNAVKPIMSAYADDLEKLAQRGQNLVVQDFLTLSSQYLRAYVPSVSTYIPANSFLSGTANMVKSVLVQACKAAEG